MVLEAHIARGKNRDEFIFIARTLGGSYALQNGLLHFTYLVLSPANLEDRLALPSGAILKDPEPDDNQNPFLAYAWATASNRQLTDEFIEALGLIAVDNGANAHIEFLGKSTKDNMLVTTTGSFEF